MADSQNLALAFSLGGLTVAVVAASAGLRMLRTKAVLEYKLSLANRELPYAAAFYFTSGAKTLHFTAGLFGAAHLIDLMLARFAWSDGLAATLGYLAVTGVGFCGLAMIGLGAIDFKVKLSPRGKSVFQVLAGIAAVGVAVIGIIALSERGYFWPPAA